MDENISITLGHNGATNGDDWQNQGDHQEEETGSEYQWPELFRVFALYVYCRRRQQSQGYERCDIIENRNTVRDLRIRVKCGQVYRGDPFKNIAAKCAGSEQETL